MKIVSIKQHSLPKERHRFFLFHFTFQTLGEHRIFTFYQSIAGFLSDIFFHRITVLIIFECFLFQFYSNNKYALTISE